MATLTSNNLPRAEIIDLSPFFPLVSPQATPLTSLLMSKKKATKMKGLYLTKMVEGDKDTTYTGNRAEGADFVDGKATNKKLMKNIAEIYWDKVKVSKTITDGFGRDGKKQLMQEATIKMSKIKGDFETSMLNAGVMSETDPRKMAGLSTFAGKKVDLKNQPLTVDGVEDAALDLFNNDLMNDNTFLVINPKDLTTLKKSYVKKPSGDDNTQTIMLTGERTVGVKVQKIMTQYGEVNILMNAKVKKGTAFLINLGSIELGELREPRLEKDTANAGDYEAFTAVMEVSFVADPKGIIQFTNIGDVLPAKLGA